MTPVVELSENEGGDHKVLAGLGEEHRARIVIGVGRIEPGEQRTGVENERHLPGRAGDRFRGGLVRGAAVSGAGHAEARTTPSTQRLGLFSDRLGEQGGERHVAAPGFRLQRGEIGAVGGDRGPAAMHDARC